MRMVYLAYPIDNAALDQEQINNLNDAKVALIENGVDLIYDPGDAFTVRRGAKPGDEIDWMNRRALNAADGVLAFMPAGMATIGVPVEVHTAITTGKWVALCSNANSWMFQHRFKGLARFGVERDDLGLAVKWLASQEDSPYPLERRPSALPVRRLDELAVLPHRQYRDDAGLDLAVSAHTVVPPASSVDVPNGVAIQLPERTWGLVIGRSSTRRKLGLLVHPGVIDAGWRGELFVNVENQTDEPVTLEVGDRVGQLIILPNYTMEQEPMEVDELAPHPRGLKGFGSTGR